jgi:hypothetical protein
VAARPKESKLKQLWLKLGHEMFGDEIDGRPVDYADWPLSIVAGGSTITALAANMGEPEYMGESCSRAWISFVLQRAPNGRERVRAARSGAADVLAEEALEISNRPVSNTAEASQARLQVDVRKWMAGVFNRNEYGDKPLMQVSLSMGELHLSALRQRAVIRAPTPPLLEPGDPDYTVEAVPLDPHRTRESTE